MCQNYLLNDTFKLTCQLVNRKAGPPQDNTILEAILFKLLHNIIRLMPINDHNIRKWAQELYFDKVKKKCLLLLLVFCLACCLP
jgi:hypothetical protein